jgi:Tol biopolymer transport system component
VRHTAIAFGLAGFAAAGAASMSAPGVAERYGRFNGTTCSWGSHVAGAVRLTPEVTVAGRSTWRFVKQGEWVRTDDQGSVDICLKRNKTQCRLGSYSAVRIQPRPAVLMRAGRSGANLVCSQNDTDVVLKHDKYGYFLPSSPERQVTAAFARRQLARPDPTGITGDPVFSLLVRKGRAVVKVRQGLMLVDTGAREKRAVVVGRNQQVAATAGRNPTPPAPIKLTPAEAKVFRVIERLVPKDPITPPEVKLSGPQDPSSVRNATLTFDSPQPDVKFSCALDGTDFRFCTSPVLFPRLDPGRHDFAVRGTGSAGDSSVAHHGWTIDGSRIVFETTRDSNVEIYTMDPDGKNVTRLTTNAVDNVDDERPAWSPDHKRIVFDSNRDRKGGFSDIYVMNADGSEVTRLTHGPEGAFNGNASWSPDGMKIVFESTRTGTSEIYTMDADGTNERQLTRDGEKVPGTAAADPVWSVDDEIAFASRISGNWQIYVMNADGSGPVRLTDNQATEMGPAWSPDGEKLLFYSDRNGHSQIWIMNANGSDQRPVTDSPLGDYNPTWAPDGHDIAFQRTQHGDIYVADLDRPDEAFRITDMSHDDNGLAPSW